MNRPGWVDKQVDKRNIRACKDPEPTPFFPSPPPVSETLWIVQSLSSFHGNTCGNWEHFEDIRSYWRLISSWALNWEDLRRLGIEQEPSGKAKRREGFKWTDPATTASPLWYIPEEMGRENQEASEGEERITVGGLSAASAWAQNPGQWKHRLDSTACLGTDHTGPRPSMSCSPGTVAFIATLLPPLNAELVLNAHSVSLLLLKLVCTYQSQLEGE